MVKLDIDAINLRSPYDVIEVGDRLRFVSEYGIEYTVDFELDSNPYFQAYWFNLANPKHAKSPGDKKIPQTLICIIEEFFRKNPDIMLYMCSTDNEQQAQRARLFLRWFNGYEQRQQYFIKAIEVKGEQPPTKEYVALIVQRSHPQFDDIVNVFDAETSMFNELKP